MEKVAQSMVRGTIPGALAQNRWSYRIPRGRLTTNYPFYRYIQARGGWDEAVAVASEEYQRERDPRGQAGRAAFDVYRTAAESVDRAR